MHAAHSPIQTTQYTHTRVHCVLVCILCTPQRVTAFWSEGCTTYVSVYAKRPFFRKSYCVCMCSFFNFFKAPRPRTNNTLTFTFQRPHDDDDFDRFRSISPPKNSPGGRRVYDTKSFIAVNGFVSVDEYYLTDRMVCCSVRIGPSFVRRMPLVTVVGFSSECYLFTIHFFF